MFKKISFFIVVFLFSRAVAHGAHDISAIWANNGEDKITRDELRASHGKNVLNSVWNGAAISVFGGRNETIAFNVVLEAARKNVSHVSVTLDRLDGPAGSSIVSAAVTGDKIFDWTQRPIELFFVRYLQIKGLSRLSYGHYDERLIPKRLRRTWVANGRGVGAWLNRPGHDKFYPDIAVPVELVPTFDIPAGSNQSIWADIYIPKNTAPGNYVGHFAVRENGKLIATLPVDVKVCNFTLPDTPMSKTMLYFSSANISHRYLGSTYVGAGTPAGAAARLVRDRHYLLAHRHRIAMIGESPADCDTGADRPCPESVARLDGSLFTASNGYAGPGVGVGNGIYSVGSYGTWNWKAGGRTAMREHTDAWASWFARNAPTTEYFLYLVDESTNTAQTEAWAKWMATNPGPGKAMRSMATLPLPAAASQAPSLDIPTSSLGVGMAAQWQPLADRYTQDQRKRFFMYNGSRPASGSVAIEDDGVALRELAWGQYKKHINRWFMWESTYYNNYQGGTGETNVFETAQTFGGNKSLDPVIGQTGWNYGNGEGVLFYPGTDRLYPKDSYNVNGPFASLRLKHWRRGIQDVDYLKMAAAVDPAKVRAIVDRMIPKVLWEYGVDSPSDPTYVHTDVSWSNDPDAWEKARAELAELLSTAPHAR